MIREPAVMIHYEKYDQQVYIKTCKFIVLYTISAACYMFRLPTVAIFREVFFAGYITLNVKII